MTLPFQVNLMHIDRWTILPLHPLVAAYRKFL